MKNNYAILLFLLLALFCHSQNECKTNFVKDTLFIPALNKTFNGEYVQTVLKNKSIVQFYRLENHKYYLKLIVTENLYFEKIDLLELFSGTKSYSEKDCRQYQLSKASAYYILEVQKNYIGTLKDDGITGIQFGKAVTSFTARDANQIKQISKCLYETIAVKK